MPTDNIMTTNQLKSTIADYCATRPEIVACYLYGSRAKGKDRPGSDVDLAFLLDSSVVADEYYNLKMAYYAGLGELLRLDIHPLIMNVAGEVVLGQVFGKGKLLYQQNSETLRTFRRHKLPFIAEFSYYVDLRLNRLRSRYGGASCG
jgi:uncharacterized protein